MTRAVVIIRTDADRRLCKSTIDRLKAGDRVEFKKARRSLPQNDRFWAMLSDVARQKDWHGVRLTPDDWKLVFLDALKREVRIVPNLDGTGFVNLGTSSSDLGVGEMSDLMEIIAEWGARNGVTFHEREAA